MLEVWEEDTALQGGDAMNEIMMGAKFYIGVELAKLAEAAVIFVAVAIVYFVAYMCLTIYHTYKRK